MSLFDDRLQSVMADPRVRDAVQKQAREKKNAAVRTTVFPGGREMTRLKAPLVKRAGKEVVIARRGGDGKK